MSNCAGILQHDGALEKREQGSTWHKEGRWKWGQCIRILKDRVTSNSRAVATWADFLFFYADVAWESKPAHYYLLFILTVLLGGEKRPPGQACLLLLSLRQLNKPNLIIFTEEYCTALYAALDTRCVCAYVFGTVSSQQEHLVFPIPASMFSPDPVASSHSLETCPHMS